MAPAWRASGFSGNRRYDAQWAGQESRRRHVQLRGARKLAVDGVLFGVVDHCLRESRRRSRVRLATAG